MGMDKEAFRKACEQVVEREKIQKGIGTLSEKTLHAVLKHYYCQNEENQEVKVDGYVADICRGNQIIEIQTANFNKMRNKLDRFLTDYQVTIVYPVAATKWLLWIDQETGEISKRRKSPKTGQPYEAFFELYKIKHYLSDPNLTICILLFDSEEYRFLNGWSIDRKRGSARCDRIPVALADELWLQCKRDYQKMIPEGLPSNFTTDDYKKCSGLSIKSARTALHVLHYLGAVERIGKQGNKYIYIRSE